MSDARSAGDCNGDTPADGREPITRRVHENSWSATLEEPHHADDRDRVVAEAIDAIEATAPGHHVNLVTHAVHGHPADYLWPALESSVTENEATLAW